MDWQEGYDTEPENPFITDGYGLNVSVRVDTGNYLTGILGCLRLDDMQEFYVSEFEN